MKYSAMFHHFHDDNEYPEVQRGGGVFHQMIFI